MTESLPDLPCIADYVRHWAERRPEELVLIAPEGNWSWARLAREMEECARAMLASGVKPRDRVGVLAGPRPEVVVTFLAASLIGAVWTGFNPVLTREELTGLAARGAPTLLFAADRARYRDLRELSGELARVTGARRLVHFDAADQDDGFAAFLREGEADSGSSHPWPELAPRDPLLLVFTSGSTGWPKGVLLPRVAAARCSREQWRHWGARRDRTRLINPFPIAHVAFLLDGTCLVLVSGGTMVLRDRFLPAEYLEDVARHRVTVVALIPTMHRMLLDDPGFAAADLSCVEVACVGGASLSRDLAEALLARYPRVSVAYGSTETAGQILFSGETDGAAELAGALGRDRSGYEIGLADEHGAPVPRGETGEVRLREDFMLNGYLDDPGAQRAAITGDGWLRTGDLARIGPDGVWRMVGRLHARFRSGGYFVEPEEIEARLAVHPGVRQAAVVPRDDPFWGQVGIAFVSGSDLDAEALEAWCRETLAGYKIPKRFVVLDTLPLLPVGKVDRRALAALAATLPSGEARVQPAELPCGA